MQSFPFLFRPECVVCSLLFSVLVFFCFLSFFLLSFFCR
jgi:hypothetical protein